MWQVAFFVFLALLFPGRLQAAEAGQEQDPNVRVLSFVPGEGLRGNMKDLRIDLVFPLDPQAGQTKKTMIKALNAAAFRVNGKDIKTYPRKCEIFMRKWTLPPEKGDAGKENGFSFMVSCWVNPPSWAVWSPTFDTPEAVMAFIKQVQFPSP